MGYNFPVPFGNVPCSIIGSVVTYVATWLGFKSEFRSQPAFRQKFKSFLLFQTVVITIGFHGFFINAAFEKLTTYQSKHGIQLQWTVAFLIPISRGIYERLLPKLLNKTAGPENEAAMFFIETGLGVSYTIYVTVALSSAYISTTYWILGVELCINLLKTLQIIRMQNKVQGGCTAEEILIWRNKKQGMIRRLVAMETIEILVPVAYSICYATAYFGPNAKLIGGVKNNYWQNAEVIDIKDQLFVLLQMAGFDACGAIVIGTILRTKCKVNIFVECCNILKKYWIPLSIHMGGSIFRVINIILHPTFKYFF